MTICRYPQDSSPGAQGGGHVLARLVGPGHRDQQPLPGRSMVKTGWWRTNHMENPSLCYHPVSSNMAGWKMDHRHRWFCLTKTYIHRGFSIAMVDYRRVNQTEKTSETNWGSLWSSSHFDGKNILRIFGRNHEADGLIGDIMGSLGNTISWTKYMRLKYGYQVGIKDYD